MYHHTHPVLTRLLKARLTTPHPRPILLTGPTGVGKFTALEAYIRDHNCPSDFHPFSTGVDAASCTCTLCTKIRTRQTIDYLALHGADSIASIRERLASFVNFTPKELKGRYLHIKHAQLMSKDTADHLLKLLEQPPAYLQIALTASDAELLPPAIASRCHHFHIGPLLPADVSFIAARDPLLQAAQRSLDAYPWTSLRQLLTYHRYGLEQLFELICARPAAPIDVITRTKELWAALADDPAYPKEEARAFALKFIIDRYTSYLTGFNHATDPSFFDHQFYILHSLVLIHGNRLFREIANPKAGMYINLENQVLAFFLCLLIGRSRD